MSYLKKMMSDETGEPSWFRHAATAALVFAGWFTVRAVQGKPVPDTVWEFWQPIVLTLLAGAGGPRLVQYLAPIAVAAVQKVRGILSSSYRETEIQQETTVVDDDPVPNGPVKLQ